jgi:hypothetical protein
VRWSYLLLDQFGDKAQLLGGRIPVTAFGKGLSNEQEVLENLVDHVCRHLFLTLNKHQQGVQGRCGWC